MYIDSGGHQIPLEPGLQVVESLREKAGNQPSILCEICQYSEYHRAVSLKPSALLIAHSPFTLRPHP